LTGNQGSRARCEVEERFDLESGLEAICETGEDIDVKSELRAMYEVGGFFVEERLVRIGVGASMPESA